MGTDYVTISGIDLQENASNTTATMRMEWGFAIVKLSATDGSQNINISNCTVTLNKTNTESKGIYGGNHTATSTSALTISSSSGINANIKINGNTVSNCYIPIYIYGYTSSSTYYDTGLEIGSTFGNTISNYGGSSVNTYGITISGQTAPKIENNTVTLGAGTTTTAYGINVAGACIGYVKINSNTVSVSSSASGSQLAGINNLAPITTTIDITNNTIRDCNYTTATSGNFMAIYEQGATTGSTVNITGNTITGTNYGTGALAGNGENYYICVTTGSPTEVNVNNNIIYNNTRTGSLGGITNAIYINKGSTQTANNNQIYNNTINGTGNGGTFYGIRSGVGTIVNTSNSIYNNQITKSTATGTIYCIYNSSSPANETYSGNTIYGNTTAGTGTVAGIYRSSGSSTRNISSNTIYGLSSLSSVYGIYNGGNNNNTNIFGNSIFNLTSLTASSQIWGIHVVSGLTVNIYNNFISDLMIPGATVVNAIIGISIGSGTTVNLYYNTVYLNATGGATFGSSGVFKSATVISEFRNNVIVNVSTPGSTSGITAAIRWDGAYNATYYTATSDNNCLYAGTPAANRLIFFDLTNRDQTIGDYKMRVSPRDVNSFSENPPFVNVSTTPYDLHLNSSVSTFCESGGTPVLLPNITTDYEGDTRNATTPDIGADEFDGFIDYMWMGEISSDWNNPGNWNPAKVPGFSSNVTINSVKAQAPVINSEAYCKNLYTGSGAVLTISNGNNLNVYGNITNNGTVTCGNSSTVALKGSALQTTAGNSLSFGNLTLDNISGAMLGSDITVNNTLTLTNGILYTKNGSTLHTIYFSGTAAPFTEVNENNINRISGKAVMNQRTLSGSDPLSFLGVVLEATSEPIDFTIERITEIPESIVTINSKSGIACKWHVSTATAPTISRHVTYKWLSALDNGNIFATANAQLWVSTDGLNWSPSGAATLTTSNPRSLQTLTTTFSIWTVSDIEHPLPVKLYSFNYSITNKNNVRLSWVTETEQSNKGFEVQRKALSEKDWTKAGFVESKGSSNGLTNYFYEDKKLNIGKYNYRLKQIDNNGNFTFHELNTDVEIGLPAKFDLSQNYPNPFNPVTKIDFDLPFDGRVSIIIYDITGREVKTLVNEQRTAGYYTVIMNGAGLSSGMYFYRIVAKADGREFVMTKKMVLVK
jgi:hypothetical protein